MKTSCSRSLLCLVALFAMTNPSGAFSGNKKNSFVGRALRARSSSGSKQLQGKQILKCVMQVPRSEPLSSGSSEDASWLAKTFLERTGKETSQAIPVEFVAETELPTDLGPFRAVEANALKKLKMTDQAFGWTVQMQLHAIFEDIRVIEVPVDYRPRIGHSKISGTIRGTILAGHAIIGTILKSAMKKYLGRQQA